METALTMPSHSRPAASLSQRCVVHDDASLDAVDSAFGALTDFEDQYPFTVEADCSIAEARAEMKRVAVHALLVTQQEIGSEDQQVIGLITYYDIERRFPHRYPQASVSPEIGELCVGEVMTACDDLALVKYGSLETLTALELYETFQGTGLTHLLVVECHNEGSMLARGLVSRAALATRLSRARRAPG